MKKNIELGFWETKIFEELKIHFDTKKNGFIESSFSVKKEDSVFHYMFQQFETGKWSKDDTIVLWLVKDVEWGLRRYLSLIEKNNMEIVSSKHKSFYQICTEIRNDLTEPYYFFCSQDRWLKPTNEMFAEENEKALRGTVFQIGKIIRARKTKNLFIVVEDYEKISDSTYQRILFYLGKNLNISLLGLTHYSTDLGDILPSSTFNEGRINKLIPSLGFMRQDPETKKYHSQEEFDNLKSKLTNRAYFGWIVQKVLLLDPLSKEQYKARKTIRKINKVNIEQNSGHKSKWIPSDNYSKIVGFSILASIFSFASLNVGMGMGWLFLIIPSTLISFIIHRSGTRQEYHNNDDDIDSSSPNEGIGGGF